MMWDAQREYSCYFKSCVQITCTYRKKKMGETNLLFSRNAKRELRGYELPLTFYPISALKHKKAGCLALFKSL